MSERLPLSLPPKEEMRCGAFGTATGRACILEADHAGPHVLETEAMEEFRTSLDALLELTTIASGDAVDARDWVEVLFRKMEARYEEARDTRNALIRILGGSA